MSFCESLDVSLKDIVSTLNEVPERCDEEDVIVGSEKLDALIKKFETMKESDHGYFDCLEEMMAEDKRLDVEFKRRMKESDERISKLLDDITKSLGL